MEDIFEFKVSKQDLARIPADERAFLFFLGQAINEISCLSKITYMSGNASEGHKLIENVHVGQTLILLRILIGKVHEAWTLFRQSPVRKIYRDGLSQEQKDIEQALGKRLGRTPSYAASATLRFTSITMLLKLIMPSMRYPTTSPGSFIYRTRSEIPFTTHRNLSCSA